MTTVFRQGREGDLDVLSEIYNHYVRTSHLTLNTSPIAVSERLDWFREFTDSGPRRLLVAEREGVILGCAYSEPYRDHPAFDETVETSIYLAPGARGEGLGTSLYRELFVSLRKENLITALAGIVLPNEASIALHRKVGFTEVGIFKNYAKVGRAHVDALWMQKNLKA